MQCIVIGDFMIVCYLDCSQKNIDINKQRDIVNQYAQDKACIVDVFFSDLDIKNIKNNINSKENTIIVANIVCLGNKLITVVENIEFIISSGFTLISVKENVKFDSSEETNQLINGMRLSIDIRNSMVSTITRKALDDKRSKGYKLGRFFTYKRLINKRRLECKF